MTEIKRHSVTGYGRQDICYNEPEGEFVYYDDHAAIVAALQEQVRAWEKENAAMRSAINQTIGWQESVDPSNTESVRMLVDLTTPNTDATNREIRAQAMDAAIDAMSKSGAQSFGDCVVAVNSIRAGEQP